MNNRIRHLSQTQTKEFMNLVQTKVFKIFLTSLAAVFLMASSHMIFRYISLIPEKVKSYQGVVLGMSMEEVKYILGYPDGVLHPVENLSTKKDKVFMAQLYATKEEIERSNNGVNDFFDWKYNAGLVRIDIKFDPLTQKINSIGCYINKHDILEADGACAINGIQALDSEEAVFERLGKPSNIEIKGITKTITYSNYNMEINLAKKVVFSIKVEEIK